MPPVRGVYRNPGRWRAVINQQEIRHSTAGCLLSVVLFAPLFVRAYGVASVAAASLLYAGVVVPALAGYYSLPGLITLVCCRLLRSRHDISPTTSSSSTRPSLHQSWILPTLNLIVHTLTSLLLFLPLQLCALISSLSADAIWRDLTQVVCTSSYALSTCLVSGLLVSVLVLLLPVLGVPLLLHVCWKDAGARGGSHGTAAPSLKTEFITVNQAVMFVAAERLLLGEQVRVLGLSHLLVYSTASYIAARYLGAPPPVFIPRGGGAPGYLAGTGWLMAGKLAKGTVVSVLLSLSGYQYLDGRHLLYTALTLLYYLLTENKRSTRDGGGSLVSRIKKLHISALEEDEEFWVPALLNTLSIFTSILFLLPLILPFQTTWIHSIYTFLIGLFLSEPHQASSLPPSTNILATVSLFFTSLAALVHSSINDILSGFLPIFSASSSGEVPLKVFRLQGRLNQGNNYPDLISLWQGHPRPSGWWLLLAEVGLYTNVALPALSVWQRYVEYQRDRGGTLSRFKRASKQECVRQETCAVCLEDLTCGRITTCGHVYHAHCLRSMLNTNIMDCPLCKRLL